MSMVLRDDHDAVVCVIVCCNPDKEQETVDQVLCWPGGAYPIKLVVYSHPEERRPTKLMNMAYAVHCYEPNADGARRFNYIMFIHSDVEVYTPDWHKHTIDVFQSYVQVGVVGWGGALGIGHPDIYKIPYHISQLARTSYASNDKHAQNHGGLWTWNRGAREVATLDGFCLAVRCSLFDQVGGFPDALPFHNYDNWLCLRSHQLGFRVMQVGVNCWHKGGGHSVRGGWDDWARRKLGKSDEEVHKESHVWLYEQMRGVLPVRVKENEGTRGQVWDAQKEEWV